MTFRVSIIIPSAGRRPELLQRAVKSALIDNDEIQTEVIVILNGKNGMLFDESISFQHPLVKYYKLEEGNVSKARNYGLSIAQGELIRFLDDDDYLIPQIAYQQYIELFDSSADLSTYAGAIEDEVTRYQVIVPIDINDYCAATLSANCPALTFASVYKKIILKNCIWDESLSFMEDENWMRSIAEFGVNNWIHKNDIVGIWYQHEYERLSITIGSNHFYQSRAVSIIKLINFLTANNQLTPIRACYAAKGLWSAIHGGFPFNPIYWTNIAKTAINLDEKSRPNQYIFELFRFFNPVCIEWFLLPLRKISRYFRMMKQDLFGKPSIRRI